MDTTGPATRVQFALPAVVQESSRVQIVALPSTSRVLIALQTPTRELAPRPFPNARATLDTTAQVARVRVALPTPTRELAPPQFPNAHATQDTSGPATHAICVLPVVLRASTKLQTVPLPLTLHVQIAQQTPTRSLAPRHFPSARAMLGTMARVAHVQYVLSASLQHPRVRLCVRTVLLARMPLRLGLQRALVALLVAHTLRRCSPQRVFPVQYVMVW